MMSGFSFCAAGDPSARSLWSLKQDDRQGTARIGHGDTDRELRLVANGGNKMNLND